jgi:hypothetical protein
MNDTTAKVDANARTRPWHPDEYLHVDGLPVVYDTDGHGITLVHLPGGGSATLVEIAAAGFAIHMPRTLRTEP